MFSGQYKCILDWRKSFVIPEKYLAILAEQPFGKRSLYFMGSDTIYIYSEEDFGRFLDAILERQQKKQRRELKAGVLEDIMLASSKRVRCNRKGRVKIPTLFTEAYSIKPYDSLFVIGCDDHIEVWKKEQWLTQEDLSAIRKWNLSDMAHHLYR